MVNIAEIEDEFYLAIEQGNSSIIKELLSNGIDVNTHWRTTILF